MKDESVFHERTGAVTNSSKNLPYDPSDAESIVKYAQVLVGSTLREHVDVDAIADPLRRKGSFGNAVERYFFGYDINSDAEPDFPEAGLELKTTPLRRNRKGELSSKERLVITMINYLTVVDEKFETSSLLRKSSDILLISYLYEKDKDPLDYEIELVARWGLPECDLPQIRCDWNTVVDKIRAGKAHEISGSDTMYLEACTKSSDSSVRRAQPFSDMPAKPRAWALKASYMTAVSNELIEKMEAIRRTADEESLDLLGLVRKRFEAYRGLTEDELAERFALLVAGRRRPKSLCALITQRILGVDEESKIEEFEKAGIKPKTLRLKRNGRPKEAMSFPAFDYRDLVETDFEDSDFYGYLQQKFLFVIYREDEAEQDVYRLSGVMFWQMPEGDLDEARRCYDEMRLRVRSGHAEDSVRASENRCCHVRPHGRDSSDTCMTPYGVPVVKKSFWLNQGYRAEQVYASAAGRP